MFRTIAQLLCLVAVMFCVCSCTVSSQDASPPPDDPWRVKEELVRQVPSTSTQEECDHPFRTPELVTLPGGACGLKGDDRQLVIHTIERAEQLYPATKMHSKRIHRHAAETITFTDYSWADEVADESLLVAFDFGPLGGESTLHFFECRRRESDTVFLWGTLWWSPFPQTWVRCRAPHIVDIYIEPELHASTLPPEWRFFRHLEIYGNDQDLRFPFDMYVWRPEQGGPQRVPVSMMKTESIPASGPFEDKAYVIIPPRQPKGRP